MKSIALYFILILFLLQLTACDSTNDGDVEQIPIVPVFGINPANKTGRVSYGSNDTAGEMSFTLLSPILMGFQDNNANVNTGDTLEYDILGETLTITLDYNESTGVCIMNGTFSDGASYINLTMRSQENTFDYEQYIIVEDDPINPPAQGIGGGAAIVYYNYS